MVKVCLGQEVSNQRQALPWHPGPWEIPTPDLCPERELLHWSPPRTCSFPPLLNCSSLISSRFRYSEHLSRSFWNRASPGKPLRMPMYVSPSCFPFVLTVIICKDVPLPHGAENIDCSPQAWGMPAQELAAKLGKARRKALSFPGIFFRSFARTRGLK